MAAKIGILGEGTAITKTTVVTLYTVPSSKAARVKLFYLAEAGAAGAIAFMIGSPNTEQTINMIVVSTQDQFTGSLPESTPNPLLSIKDSVNGIQKLVGAIDLNKATGLGSNYIGAPLKEAYFMSTGDTVRVRIDDQDLSAVLFQVVGVEDDA